MTTRRSRTLLVLAVLVVAVTAVLLTNVFPYRQILAQQRQVSAASDRLEALQVENARLERQAEALRTDEEIERLARENLGYVRPGEIAYVVLEPPAEPTPATPEPATEPEEPRQWYEKVWDFLTGKDLTEKGS
jgi:cell division protein FtsB